MGRFFGTIPFLLQVLLVIVGVVLFSFLDPFGIFVSSKLKLKDTPVDVRSIQDIGQLITAEYYGEVVRSYAYQIREENQKEVDDLKSELEELNLQFWDVVNELRPLYKNKQIKRTRKQVYKLYETKMGDFISAESYELFLYYTYRELYKEKRYKLRHLDDELRQGKAEKFIRELVRNEEIPIGDERFVEGLVSRYQEYLLKEEKKITRKSNLVMLGRGWVKAGFDFGKFTQENFRYDPESNRINFVGFMPSIISATINPWFIPEKGVEGFEFLIVERRAKKDYRIVQTVKQMCLDELKRKAIVDRQILSQAVKNAEANMKEFFGLILEDPIDHVRFYDDELTFAYEEITRNDSISGEELILINSLLKKASILGIDSSDLTDEKNSFIANIQTWLDGKGSRRIYPFNVKKWEPHLALFYEITSDGVYSEFSDKKLIETYRFTCQKLDDIDQVDEAKLTNNLAEYVYNNTHLLMLSKNDSSEIEKILQSAGGRKLLSYTYEATVDSLATVIVSGNSNTTISEKQLTNLRAMNYQMGRSVHTLVVNPLLDKEEVLGFRLENNLASLAQFKLFFDTTNVAKALRCGDAKQQKSD